MQRIQHHSTMKQIHHIVCLSLLLASIFSGARGQDCSVEDFCCTFPEDTEDGSFTKIAHHKSNGYCFIQGSVVESDCPTGWHYQPDYSQCIHNPSAWSTNSFSNLKSCAESSHSCPSVEDLCGNPTLRSGLRLMLNCHVQADEVIHACPPGWQNQGHQCVKSVLAGMSYYKRPEQETEHEENAFEKCFKTKNLHECPHYASLEGEKFAQLTGFDGTRWGSEPDDFYIDTPLLLLI